MIALMFLFFELFHGHDHDHGHHIQHCRITDACGTQFVGGDK